MNLIHIHTTIALAGTQIKDRTGYPPLIINLLKKI